MTPSQFPRSRFAKIMTYTAFQKLENLLHDSQHDFPYPMKAVNYFNASRPARLLTEVILKYVKLSGGSARENVAGGLKKGAKGWEYVHSWQKTGVADVTVMYDGRVMEVEIKIKDRQSEAQKKYQQEMEKVGVPYHIVKDFDQFIEVFGEFRDG